MSNQEEEEQFSSGYPFLDSYISSQKQRPILFYDQKLEKWRPSEISSQISETKFKSLSQVSSFKLLTLNVYFDTLAQDQRSEAFVKVLEDQKPDVVCLQEVTKEFLSFVTKSPYVRQRYWITHDAEEKELYDWVGYGVCMLGSIQTMPLPRENKASIWSFPTSMCRELLQVEFPNDEANSTSFSIGTVHLESMHHPAVRAKQLYLCCRTPLLRNIPHRIICGDFNFDSSRNYHENPYEKVVLENDQLKRYKEFVDVWPLLRPEEKGYTFDTQVNTMKADKYERFRFDRILLKSSPPISPSAASVEPATSATSSSEAAGEWRAKTIELVGTEKLLTLQLPTHKQDIFLSDHFGLVSEFCKN